MPEPTTCCSPAARCSTRAAGTSGGFDVAVTRRPDRRRSGPTLPRRAGRSSTCTGRLVTPGPGRPAHARLPGRRLLGHRPRPDRLVLRRHHLGRRRVRRARTRWPGCGGTRPPGRVRVHALVNIAGQGLAARTGEGRDLDGLRPGTGGRGWSRRTATWSAGSRSGSTRKPWARTGSSRCAARSPPREACGVPVMVHVGIDAAMLDEVLDLLRPGDVLTHCASGLADADRARRRPRRTGGACCSISVTARARSPST